MGLTPAAPAGPADSCAACLPAAVTVAPYRCEWDPGGARAFYRCPDGHKWWTGWLLTPAEIAQYETGDAA